MKTIKFNPELESFLKENRIKTKFAANVVVNCEVERVSLKEKIEQINEYDIARSIVVAFIWYSTPEAYDFWFKIYRKACRKI